MKGMPGVSKMPVGVVTIKTPALMELSKLTLFAVPKLGSSVMNSLATLMEIVYIMEKMYFSAY